MLEVKNASLKVHGRLLLENITFNVTPGELVTICGPNGAGKSSLIRMISGELKTFSGDIHWHGKSLKQWDIRHLARHRALLQQKSEVGFDYTAKEIILLGRHPHHQGATRNIDMHVADQALQEVEATHLANQIYSTLSGGEQARIQMARILSQIWESSDHPRLLLLDEPTAALDPRQQHRILSLARKWANKQDVAVIAIVHDLNLAAQYADRIALLKDGKLQRIDTIQNIVTPETVEACFDLPCVLLSHPDGGTPIIAAKRN